MIPSAPRRFSSGISLRTCRSSMIVSTATHSSEKSGEMVGLRSAGSRSTIEARSSRRTFSFRPTLPSARMAPSSSSARFSIFSRFHGSCHASWLATSWVLDESSTSTMRSLLARSELPVSVTSTMASTRSGALTSVAPHENSTSAVTPCSASQRSVSPTTSVAIRLPSRSFTEWMSESSGTASTQRTGRMDAFEYTRSATTCTSAPVSAIQSRPVMPASNTPSATYLPISWARTSIAVSSSSSMDGK